MSFGDTTIKGFKIDPGWNASSKEEIKKYQRKKNLVLFQLQKEKTRYGDTAFFIQAPGDECYNKLKDCSRPNGEKQKIGELKLEKPIEVLFEGCLLYTSPSPRDKRQSRMPSSA